MTAAEIVNAVKNIKGGTIHSITYCSEVPVKAAVKKTGVRITKVTKKLARFGVSYAAVATPVGTHKESSYHTVLPNRVYHNDSTNSDYVRITFLNKPANSHSVYYLENGTQTVELTKEEVANYTIPSYFSNKKPSLVQNIKFDHIINIH